MEKYLTHTSFFVFDKQTIIIVSLSETTVMVVFHGGDPWCLPICLGIWYVLATMAYYSSPPSSS